MADAGHVLRESAWSGVGPRPLFRRGARLLQRFRSPIISVLFLAGDVGAASLATLVTGFIVGTLGYEAPSLNLGAILIFLALCGAAGLYSAAGPSAYERFRLRAIASVCAAALLLLLFAPRNFIECLLWGTCEAVLLVVLGHYADAAVRGALMRANLWAATTVLVGRGDKSRHLAGVLLAHAEIGLMPIGFVAAVEDEAEGKGGEFDEPLPILGSVADLGKLHVQVAIFTSAHELATAISRQPQLPSATRLLLVEDTTELGSLWLRPRMLGDTLGIEIGRYRGQRGHLGLKRTMDLLVAIPVALLALPLVALLAGLVALVSWGPAIYRQTRVGRDGKPIEILKLRTMYIDSERRLEEHFSRDAMARAEWERFFKLKDDPRVLPLLGNFLRRSSLDELPQLWNVIRGDMSLVGPRPFPAYHVQAFDPSFRIVRMSVQPGMTGLWQISARSNGDLDVQRAQDLFYIKNWSLWLDLYILLQTLPAVVLGSGAR